MQIVVKSSARTATKKFKCKFGIAYTRTHTLVIIRMLLVYLLVCIYISIYYYYCCCTFFRCRLIFHGQLKRKMTAPNGWAVASGRVLQTRVFMCWTMTMRLLELTVALRTTPSARAHSVKSKWPVSNGCEG